MSSTEMADEVRAYVAAEFLAGEDASDLTGDYDLIESGVLHSLGLVRLLSHFTETYRLPVDELDFTPDDFRTIDSMVALILEHRPATV
ncbi:acyl carrier protein [Kitasatospora sp. NPDC051853]|uniref:acyl carrier protein n=1 Tax=Kitasatospora sp. NPDC051853 TaxID=3364058 RepID=UPI0037B2A471